MIDLQKDDTKGGVYFPCCRLVVLGHRGDLSLSTLRVACSLYLKKKKKII